MKDIMVTLALDEIGKVSSISILRRGIQVLSLFLIDGFSKKSKPLLNGWLAIRNLKSSSISRYSQTEVLD